ncbi:MAG: hypothetical protein ACFFD4_28430 [Candidatus Odinarchaeota archaeon]
MGKKEKGEDEKISTNKDPFDHLIIDLMDDKMAMEHLEFTRERSDIWNWEKHEKKIRHIELYPAELLIEIKKRFKAATKYLAKNHVSLKDIAKEYGLSSYSIKEFANGLLEGKSVVDLAKRLIGYSEKIGLLIVQTEMRIFAAEHNRMPTLLDKEMEGIRSALQRNRWKKQGINTWNQLLELTFNQVNHQFQVYKGEEGLKKAKEELKAFANRSETGRIPRANDKGMRKIRGAFERGYWEEFGVRTWNDLLKTTFNKVTRESAVYKGEDGLRRAIEKVRAFKKSNGKIPKNSDKGMGGIVGAIRRGEWIDFGIKNWNDFVLKAFGELRVQSQYIGIKGLKNAQNKVLKFRKENGKIPRKRDVTSGIYAAIKRGEWAKQGIHSWIDFIKATFGQTRNPSRKQKGYYNGEEGLKRALIEIRALKDTIGRVPSKNSKGMGSIYLAISRGEYRKFGISSWNDFIDVAF